MKSHLPERTKQRDRKGRSEGRETDKRQITPAPEVEETLNTSTSTTVRTTIPRRVYKPTEIILTRAPQFSRGKCHMSVA